VIDRFIVHRATDVAVTTTATATAVRVTVTVPRTLLAITARVA
jgi:hypothetical protein